GGAMKRIRIGNGCGFWGDNLDAPLRLAEAGHLDYLTLEYLAELTMSILAHQTSREADAGYVTDFPLVLESLLPELKRQPQLKIVTNAGGMNPAACARQAARVLCGAGLGDVPIGVATGDDLLPRLDELLAAGEPFAHLDNEEPLGDLRSEVVSANAYLGAAGIVGALESHARIILTGRVADASLTVGPAMHAFGWTWDDWDKLAAASVAGHLIECGAQMTGGMFSGWSEDVRLADVGHPIAEIGGDGSVVVAKPDGSGGAVTTATVAEQLVYEIGDPTAYLTPDVTADFSAVRLTQAGPDRVEVAGACGRPAPERLKVSLAYRDGHAVSGMIVVCGPGARQTALAAAEIVFDRVRQAGFELTQTHAECLGTGDALRGIWPRHDDGFEVVLRLAARSKSREAVERLAREIAPLVTSGPPGITGYVGARPKPHPVLAFWPTTIDRSRVLPQAVVQSAGEWNA
ncbi:MAG: acyclic terpene utilization AtuA family protein, partial [Planctomycetaceae bacterium]